MTTTKSITFRAAERDGIRIELDEAKHAEFEAYVSGKMQSKRNWTTPDNSDIADHLSHDFQCMRRWIWDKDSLRETMVGPTYCVPPLPSDKVFTFARGYAWQEFMLGDVEESRWSHEHRLWYSPDGGTQPVEVKTTLSVPLVKKEVEANLSVEDVLLTGGIRGETYFSRAVLEWQQYMMAVMYLEGWDHYWLSVAYMTKGEWYTFKFTASDHAIRTNWQLLVNRRETRRFHEQQGTVPPIAISRQHPSECDGCPYMNQEPCRTDVTMFDAGIRG